MENNQKTISMDASSIANFSLMQVLLEKLVERKVLIQEDVLSIISQSIHLNERVLPEVSSNQNSDAIYLLQQLQSSLEMVWEEDQSHSKD